MNILDQAASQESAIDTSAKRVESSAPNRHEPEWLPAPLPVRQKRGKWEGYVVTVSGPAAPAEPQGAPQRVAGERVLWGAVE